jgi:transcriptional regulator with XRE-family HTH domain
MPASLVTVTFSSLKERKVKLSMRTLSGYLKEKRTERGLSQLDVAKVLGYSSPQFVSNWERGLVSPPLETIAILIELYKVPPSEVIEYILKETKAYLETNLKPRKKKGSSNKGARR